MASLRGVNGSSIGNARMHFGTSPRVFGRAAICSCDILREELHRRTFLGTNIRVRLHSRHSLRGVVRGGFICRNNVGDFIRCVRGGHSLRIVRPSMVCFTSEGTSSAVTIRVTLRCGRDCGRGLLAFTGGVRAASNNARRRNFGETLACIVGSCTEGFKGLGSGSGGLDNRSIHRKLATVIDMGLGRTRFRKRAGTGLNGARMETVISHLVESGLSICLRRGPTITGMVFRGTLTSSETERTTEGTERGTEEGSPLSSTRLPNGLTSYRSGSDDRARVFVIRNSSTNNSTGNNHSEEVRTVLPL